MNIEYLRALNKSSFFNRYEEVSRRFRTYECMESIDESRVQQVFDDLDIQFKFYRKEYFFQHIRKKEGVEFRLHICPKYGVLETMFYKLEENGEIFGGPLSRLQKLVAIKVNEEIPGNIILDPRFHSYSNLRIVVLEMVELFDEFVEILR